MKPALPQADKNNSILFLQHFINTIMKQYWTKENNIIQGPAAYSNMGDEKLEKTGISMF